MEEGTLLLFIEMVKMEDQEVVVHQVHHLEVLQHNLLNQEIQAHMVLVIMVLQMVVEEVQVLHQLALTVVVEKHIQSLMVQHLFIMQVVEVEQVVLVYTVEVMDQVQDNTEL